MNSDGDGESIEIRQPASKLFFLLNELMLDG